MEQRRSLPEISVPLTPPDPQETGEVPMRMGKVEEGKARGEGWAAARSMLLVLAIVAVMTVVLYFGVYQN